MTSEKMTNDELYQISEEFIRAEKDYISAQKRYMEISKKLKEAAIQRIEDCKKDDTTTPIRATFMSDIKPLRFKG